MVIISFTDAEMRQIGILLCSVLLARVAFQLTTDHLGRDCSFDAKG